MKKVLFVLLIFTMSFYFAQFSNCYASMHAYVASVNSHRVDVIRTSDNIVIKEVPVEGYLPMGVAVTPDGNYVYVASINGIVHVIRTSDNTIINTIPLEGVMPWALAVTPNGDYVYVTDMDNDATVRIIRTSDNQLLKEGIPVGRGSLGVEVTPNGEYVYVTHLYDATVTVIRTSDNTIIDAVDVGDQPISVVATPNGEYVYVANVGIEWGDTVSVIRTSDRTVIETVDVGRAPWGVAVTPDGNYVYVTGDRVSVIRTSDNKVIDRIDTGGIGSGGVAVTPNGDYVYVTVVESDEPPDSVSVIRVSDNQVIATIPVGDFPICLGKFIAPFWLTDQDGDGIAAMVDTAPSVYSNDFGDATTNGTVIDRGDQILFITDEPDEPEPRGIRIVADSSGGPIPATVGVCGGTEVTLDAGDETVITCGSVEIEVVSGTVEITFRFGDGTPATTSLNEGNSLLCDPDTFTISAPSTNSEVVIVFVEGEEFSLIPGESMTVLPVLIDIKPRRFPNIIELEIDEDDDDCDDDDNRLRVAVLTDPDFNALSIDPSTVDLGDPRLDGTATPIRSRARDVDGDGDEDLLLVFSVCDLVSNGALDADSTELVLTGQTSGGVEIVGSDPVQVVVDDHEDEDDDD